MCRTNDDSGVQQSGAGHGQQGGIEEQAGEVAAEESNLFGIDSESEMDGEEGVWGRSRFNSETYKRRMVI